MGVSRQEGWFPRAGSWEEAVLTWQEQIERAFTHERVSPSEAAALAGRKGLGPDQEAPSTLTHSGSPRQ